jgi:hypothetical protein
MDAEGIHLVDPMKRQPLSPPREGIPVVHGREEVKR